ncbi:MAG: hypothetical protein ACOC0U_05740 [Desulfovibrionales bacterium]
MRLLRGGVDIVRGHDVGILKDIRVPGGHAGGLSDNKGERSPAEVLDRIGTSA